MHFSTSTMYSFKVKSLNFILFTSKLNSVSQGRLKTYFKEMEKERRLQLLMSIYSQTQCLLSCFHYVTLFQSSQTTSMWKQNKTGKSKELNKHETSSRTAKEKAPKTKSLFFFFKVAEDMSEKIVPRHFFCNSSFFPKLFFSNNIIV